MVTFVAKCCLRIIFNAFALAYRRHAAINDRSWTGAAMMVSQFLQAYWGRI